MESQLRSQTHIAKVCCTAYYTLKNVARIHNLLTPEVAKIIVQGLVISKLDYCNGLLLGISNHQLNKLQIVQNMGCRVIKNLRKFDHITEAIKDLHWLKIPEHIQFKVHNLPMCQWLSSIILNGLTRPQPHEKEFKIRYWSKTSNTTVQSLTSIQQFNQICWTKPMEWTATKYKGGKNFRIIQNPPQNRSIQQMLWLLIHFTYL